MMQNLRFDNVLLEQWAIDLSTAEIGLVVGVYVHPQDNLPYVVVAYDDKTDCCPVTSYVFRDAHNEASAVAADLKAKQFGRSL